MAHKDIIGQKFGRLLVTEYVGTKKPWKCLCECGNEVIVSTNQLTTGHTKSCGCYKRDILVKCHLIHGQSGGRNNKESRLHRIWTGMKARCNNPHVKDYPYYGGRGITVCHEWKTSFDDFHKWAIENGYSDKLTLDRIDNEKNYCPNNCRWVDRKTQMRNTRLSHYVTCNGITKTITEWSEEVGISRKTISERINAGWDVEKALGKSSMRQKLPTM